uniref:hypothetical protein n=1 Tax=Kitasatospora sp. NBC_01519 TaxID=2903576 RepID=UPI002F913965
MDAEASDGLPALVERSTEVVVAELVNDGQALAPFAHTGVDPNETLTEDAADDLASARPARTSQTYAEQWRYFARWCADNGRHPGPRTSEANMVSYVSTSAAAAAATARARPSAPCAWRWPPSATPTPVQGTRTGPRRRRPPN